MARPKGFAEWKPNRATMDVLVQINEVLREYQAHLPMTARQVFYRLVGQYGYDKTEKAYARLCEYLVRARRAGFIDFKSIRDDGTVKKDILDYEDPLDFWDSVVNWGEHYKRQRQQNQPVFIELWCEAAGMAPMLSKIAAPYGVTVYSTGGFSSVTVTREIAERVTNRKRPTVFMHLGDFDPSGESIFESMSQDVGAFVVHTYGGKWNAMTGETQELSNGEPCLFLPRRVLLTEEQVEEFQLPTAPPKRSDSRTANWEMRTSGETTQAEAMPPDLLERVTRQAIENQFDMDVYHELIQLEREERRKIVSKVDEIKMEFDEEQ